MWQTIFAIFIISNSYANITLIPDHNQTYYRSAFPDAYYQEILPINDPLTTPSINTDLIKIFNQYFIFLGYIREVNTDVGCDSFCKPLEFALTFDTQFNYLHFILPEPLTKWGHEEFSSSDYQKLQEILMNPPQSYNQITKPEEFIDGQTGATLKELQKDVVPTAAFTCFRIHQYRQQTLQYFEPHP